MSLHDYISRALMTQINNQQLLSKHKTSVITQFIILTHNKGNGNTLHQVKYFHSLLKFSSGLVDAIVL